MSRIESLKHVIQPLPGGGKVLVLNTGALITPEDTAMLQALHSRSIGGIQAHLEKLAHVGSGNFMDRWYVGYGDKSIGDCGTVTVFIDGVSMLVAKAVQDWPLYAGQESSTRYIDFATQPFVDPIQSQESRDILERWRTFYLKGLEELPADLKLRFPILEGDNPKEYEKAIRARSFDIMRGFLPAGAETNLSWHGNIRQTADKILELRHHPLLEARVVAAHMTSALQEACPHSFNQKLYEATEVYNRRRMLDGYYFERDNLTDFAVERDLIDRELLQEYLFALSERPPKTELPKQIAECGTVRFGFALDFGSFRDAQRHRAVTQRMPLVTPEHGFEPWYLNELPESLREETKTLLAEQEAAIAALHTTKELQQYYVAMGYRLPNRLTGNLHGLVWLVELRATRFVHPTLRRRARQIAHELSERFGSFGLTLHLDQEPDLFDSRRGQHDIVEKPA